MGARGWAGMRWVPGIVLVACLVASGCLASNGPAPVQQFAAGDASLAQETAAPLGGARTNVSQMRLAETDSTKYVGGGSIDFSGCSDPPARAFDLVFAGTHPVFDEFARPTPAHAFRTVERICSITFDFRDGGFHGKGELEERPYESLYDRADARYMGGTDLRSASRVFTNPSARNPFGGSLATLFLVPHWLQGNLTHETLVRDLGATKVYESFHAYDGAAPVAGDCAVWELVSRTDPAPAKPPPKPEASKLHHTLLCLPAGTDVPLWAWSGSQDGGNRTLLRTSDPMLLPRLEGAPQAPVAYDHAEWSHVASSLPALQVGDTLVPPITGPDDWASKVAQRVQALYQNPSYLQYRRASGLAYTQMVWEMPGDDGTIDSPLLPAQAPAPGMGALFDRMTWAFLSDGNATHWQDVYTRSPSNGQQEMDMAATQGNDLTGFRSIPASKLPNMVPDAKLQQQLAAVLPKDPDWRLFEVLPIEMPAGVAQYSFWEVVKLCTATEPGVVVSVDAIAGALQVIQAMHGDGKTCSTGDPASMTRCALAATILDPPLDPCAKAESWARLASLAMHGAAH